MAERLGYVDRGGLSSVERFMKHYFLVAKDVGDLTTILCSALEMEQVKTSPGLGRLLNPLSWRTRRHIRTTSDFRIDNGRLNIADPDVFKRDPVNLIRFFARAEETDAFFHPNAVRLLRRSLRLIDDKLRNDPGSQPHLPRDAAARTKNPEPTLRRMNEAGVLGRFIPDFGRVVVDDAVQHVPSLHGGRASDPHRRRPVRHRARRSGRVASALHQDHSTRSSTGARCTWRPSCTTSPRVATKTIPSSGARIARSLCPRLGMSAAETETVAWLIEQHLTMSQIAFSRDIGDPKTVRDFANVVQSPERLKLLLVLTVADIRAVGPGIWNGWKGQLLRALYYETEPVVAGGHTQLASRERVAAAQEAFRAASADWPQRTIRSASSTGTIPTTGFSTDTRKAAEHAQLVRAAERAGTKLASHFTTDAFTAITELSLLRPTIRACWRCLPGRAPPLAPTSRARTSRPRATVSRSTPSCLPASSSRTRTSCGAPGASPRPSRSFSRARSSSAH